MKTREGDKQIGFLKKKTKTNPEFCGFGLPPTCHLCSCSILTAMVLSVFDCFCACRTQHLENIFPRPKATIDSTKCIQTLKQEKDVLSLFGANLTATIKTITPLQNNTFFKTSISKAWNTRGFVLKEQNSTREPSGLFSDILFLSCSRNRSRWLIS